MRNLLINYISGFSRFPFFFLQLVWKYIVTHTHSFTARHFHSFKHGGLE